MLASKQANKDEEGQNSGGGGGGGRKTSSLRPPEQTLRCPRCDSPNTKFCYYNNYSLTQPRHFCKACRRYWTKGGALRNVPIGGSCRKNKKTKSCSSRFLLGESSSRDSSSDMGGMKFYGLSSMDFQLGGLNSFPPARVTTTNQFSSSYGDTSSIVNLDPLGFNFPISSSHFVTKQGDHHQQQQQPQLNQSGGGLASFHEMGTSNHLHHHNDLASSIESLSSINQDLHWKLQQQRLSMLFGGGGGGSGGGGEMDQQQQKKQAVLEPQVQRLQPILFQNLETSKPTQSSMDGDSRKDTGTSGGGGGGGLATEWFFDSSYPPANLNQNPNPNLNRATPTNSSTGNDQNGSINNWNGIQTWNHLNQYSSIP